MTEYLVVVRLAGTAGWLLGSASTLRSGSRHVFCQWFWPLSAISLVPSNPGDYTPRIMMTGGINHAGVLRPATPFYPDGWRGYLKGNGTGHVDRS